MLRPFLHLLLKLLHVKSNLFTLIELCLGLSELLVFNVDFVVELGDSFLQGLDYCFVFLRLVFFEVEGGLEAVEFLLQMLNILLERFFSFGDFVPLFCVSVQPRLHLLRHTFHSLHFDEESLVDWPNKLLLDRGSHHLIMLFLRAVVLRRWQEA